MARFHRRQFGLRRRLEHHLDPHQLTRHLLAQIADQPVKQLERLLLVLVQRIALRKAAPANHLPQMVERHEMLAPQMIQRLQQNLLFNVSHDIRRIFLDPPGIGLVRRCLEPVAHFLVGNAFFLRPVCRRRTEPERLA